MMAKTEPARLPLCILFFVSISALTTNEAARQPSTVEVSALMQLKAALDPGGALLLSWTVSGDPCSLEAFEGVACDGRGNVANVSLQGKGLRGYISPAVAKLGSLTGLFLHYNALMGEIPREIGGLSSLVELYLDVNNLTGGIPSEIGNLGNLQVLQLSYNQLTGHIPNQLGLLKKLNVLSLESNQLTGAIPASLGDLVQLTRLDLSYNSLFGSIPAKLTELPQLAILDVQNNSLSGSVPTDLRTLGAGFSFRNNKDLCGAGFPTLQTCASEDALKPTRPEPYGPNSTSLPHKDLPQSVNISAYCNATSCPPPTKSSSASHVVAGVAAVVAASMAASILTFTWYRRYKHKAAKSLIPSGLSADQVKNLCRKNGSPLISLEYSKGWDPLSDDKTGLGMSEEVPKDFRFNLEELECATQYFSEMNLLWRSKYSATYKGILRDGSVVVVKSISKISCKSEEGKFLRGLKMLASLKHENLVRLRGFCYSRGRGECFLVYDFVSDRSLLQFLDRDAGEGLGRVLDWPTRVGVIKGVAKGIEYLHAISANRPPLVHQNIAADNILIDGHFKPLISDSGLHKLLADNVIFSTLKTSAAMGYLAPEYATTGRFTEKSDVYAFGVIILQVLTGKRKAAHLRLGADPAKLQEIIDDNLQGDYSKQEAVKLAEIALSCTNEVPQQRPTIEEVVQLFSNSSNK